LVDVAFLQVNLLFSCFTFIVFTLLTLTIINDCAFLSESFDNEKNCMYCIILIVYWRSNENDIKSIPNAFDQFVHVAIREESVEYIVLAIWFTKRVCEC
jgi:hypothetical protein